MFTILETLFLRHPKLHYTAPPLCDADFSSSSGPTIILNDIGRLPSVTGGVLGGEGGFFLTWDSYPGALCYSIYKSNDPNDPFGTYTILFECLANPPVNLEGFGPGYFRISAITLDGETPLGPPVHFSGGGGGFGCPTIDGPPPTTDVNAEDGDIDVILGPFPVSEGFGAGPVDYEWFKDGVFFLDTTNTSKAFLQFDTVAGADTGSYTLHLSNEEPSCSVVSEPIVLDVTSGLCCDCDVIASIKDYNAADWTFDSTSYIPTGLRVSFGVPTGALAFVPIDNAWEGCTGTTEGAVDMGNAWFGFVKDGGAWFLVNPFGNCGLGNERIGVMQIEAYPVATPAGGMYDLYNNPFDVGFGTPWDGSFALTDPSHITCAVQNFPSNNINGWGGFSVQLDQVPNGINFDWTFTITQYYKAAPFLPLLTLWVGTLINAPTPAGIYNKTGGIFTGPATLELQ